MTLKTATWAANVKPGGDASRPCLVWLHGLLGSGDDWSSVLPWFADWPQVTLDLPGHGDSTSTEVRNFEQASQGLSRTLAALKIQRYVLIGYSLGGRIALYHACRDRATGLCGLFVEGAHTGLADRAERELRLEHDLAWARCFSQHSMASVLAQWYRQPVFSDLTASQRWQLCVRRGNNNGVAVAAMLSATSLARQPDLLPELQNLDVPFGYLCGERDQKFSALAQQGRLPISLVPGTGHNAHQGNPTAFAELLLSQLAPLIKGTHDA
ncbi:2-succinyl-6-hydroxy-2,4-cyclohexadiene-1-carboxylate synthase [Acerihabitans sp. TG2]|uniref:2-succinyl-6-hydroxy-2, 4-cyclohexadiene-1-carboxylate synthase n=1 Tax=Acerihabitans sp. TG2 TaxID=3096008 RepID=UPI002B22E1B4|nr:2-succinyl-6-hydroxy-2,4-cyclohexadiene-1-carboxylate synthase [Acerihabitans sp. TG2]MEA9389172.1 2-succinyl-6-hydroxy-2,4-cyclohexadiene-1-carboxylate synthase [Acerihabitans sp. TG2]